MMNLNPLLALFAIISTFEMATIVSLTYIRVAFVPAYPSIGRR